MITIGSRDRRPFQVVPAQSSSTRGTGGRSALTPLPRIERDQPNWSVAATFEGEFANVTSSKQAKGVLRTLVSEDSGIGPIAGTGTSRRQRSALGCKTAPPLKV